MPNVEKYAWLFVRLSGVVLVFLPLGHLFVMPMWDDGVYRIDLNHVAQPWHSPFWQAWDLLLLWLAWLHGGNGQRTSSMTTAARTPPASGSDLIYKTTSNAHTLTGDGIGIVFRKDFRWSTWNFASSVRPAWPDWAS